MGNHVMLRLTALTPTSLLQTVDLSPLIIPRLELEIVRNPAQNKVKRIKYDIERISYESDQWNVDLSDHFSNAYENEPCYFNEHAAAALAAGGTKRYCMSLAMGYSDTTYSNAVHGEMYINNYRGR